MSRHYPLLGNIIEQVNHFHIGDSWGNVVVFMGSDRNNGFICCWGG